MRCPDCKESGTIPGPCPWLTPPVLALARGAYEERGRKCERCGGDGMVGNVNDREPCPQCLDEHPGRIEDGYLDPGTLGILADALEEAGCDNVDLLMHLRGRGPHVRGCWATDLLLNLS